MNKGKKGKADKAKTKLLTPAENTFVDDGELNSYLNDFLISSILVLL